MTSIGDAMGREQPEAVYVFSQESAGVRRIDFYVHPAFGTLQCNVDVGEGALQFPFTPEVAEAFAKAAREWYVPQAEVEAFIEQEGADDERARSEDQNGAERHLPEPTDAPGRQSGGEGSSGSSRGD